MNLTSTPLSTNFKVLYDSLNIRNAMCEGVHCYHEFVKFIHVLGTQM